MHLKKRRANPVSEDLLPALHGVRRKKHRVDIRVISDNLQKDCCSRNCMELFRNRICDVIEFRRQYNLLDQHDQQETLLGWMWQWNACFEFLKQAVCKYDCFTIIITIQQLNI